MGAARATREVASGVLEQVHHGEAAADDPGQRDLLDGPGLGRLPAMRQASKQAGVGAKASQVLGTTEDTFRHRLGQAKLPRQGMAHTGDRHSLRWQRRNLPP